jgi:hypothetical protein
MKYVQSVVNCTDSIKICNMAVDWVTLELRVREIPTSDTHWAREQLHLDFLVFSVSPRQILVRSLEVGNNHFHAQK